MVKSFWWTRIMSRFVRELCFLGAAYAASVALYAGVLLFTQPWQVVAVRVGYNVSTVVFPVFLLGFAAQRTAVGRRRIAIASVLFAVAGFCMRIYATHIEPRQLQVHEVTIVTDKLTQPVLIAHISDIQSDGISDWESAVFERIRLEKPDLVIHTGDILQIQPPKTYSGELDKLAPLLTAIEAPLGRFHALGDTDWPIHPHLETFAGFETLRNDSRTITSGQDRIRLYGVGVRAARAYPKSRDAIVRFREADPHAFNIVFAHPPDFVLGIEDQPVDLCLAGHTHGGQIRVPFHGPLITATEVPNELARGFHQVGRTRLNTSAGIGAEHAHGLPSIRFNCPPEITMIRLVPADETIVRAQGAPQLGLSEMVD